MTPHTVDLLINQLIPFAAGGGLGLVLGYMSQELHAVTEKVVAARPTARRDLPGGLMNETAQGSGSGSGSSSARGPRGPRGWTGRHGHDAPGTSLVHRVALGTVVFATVVAAIVAGHSSTETRENLEHTEALAECLRDNQLQVITALDARTGAIEAEAEASNVLDKAQSTFLEAISRPRASPKVEEAAFRTYIEALQEKLDVYEEVAATRLVVKYPTEADVRRCGR